jgi:ACR3 family arsenite efflux pump ArsB
LITVGIALAMLYTGMLFDWSRIRASLTPQSLRAFCGLALLNYLLVPLGTWSFFLWLGSDHSALQLALLILAVLPCAPLVPAIVSLAGEPPEWSLLVFLGFSLLSLLFTVALAVLMTHASAVLKGADVAAGLLHYLAAVYVPMLVGQLLALSSGAWVATALRVLRPVAAGALLISVVLFAVAHRDQLAATTKQDLAVMLLFQLFCVFAALFLGERYGGSRLTRLISSGFRNFALAIAFAAVVLDRTDVSAYVIVFSVVTLPVCALTCLLAAPRSTPSFKERFRSPRPRMPAPLRRR